MAGILLALQVNNWNEQKNLRDIERGYLSRLAKDLTTHIATYENNVDYVNDRLYAIDYILKRIELPSEKLIRDSITIHLNTRQWIGSLQIDMNLYNDIVNTGNMKIFQNENLRIDVQDYYHLIKKYNSAIVNNNRFYVENGLKFYMKHLAQGYIMRSLKGVDKELQTLPKRKLFSLWDKGYFSDEMKEFENNLYFRRTDLSMELDKNLELKRIAERLVSSINNELEVK